jgi:hypothetical protein
MKTYIKIFVFSLIAFLLTFWVDIFQNSLITIVIESAVFMLLTFYILKKYAPKTGSSGLILLSIVLGRVILELPARLADIHGTSGSIPILLVCLLSIFCGYWCYKKNKSINWIISALVIILLALISHHFID